MKVEQGIIYIYIHILKILLPERKLYQEKEKDYKIFTILVYLHGVILK
jgi:hypothetical protein